MKPVRFSIMAIFLAFMFLAISPFAHSQQSFLESYNPVNLSQPGGNSYLNLMVGLRKYFNSFTSWQFPNSQGPQDPLSRLEYPWDQTFLAIKGSVAYASLEVCMEWSGTFSVFSNPKAQDSDWTFRDNPGQKTIFSEAEAKPRCWIVDLSAAIELPGFQFLRGILGYRTSQFKFTDTDGYANSIDPQHQIEPKPSGPAIEFSQFYQHLYAGGIVDTAINFSETPNGLRIPPILIRIQADASYVIGKNHDEHLLRGYELKSWVKSTGFGWHVNLATGFRTGRYKFDVEGDVRIINTRGTMDDLNGDPDGPYFRVIDGAKAWSEQKYVGINGTIFF